MTDEGYVGIDVHRAARIAAAAHGGQIVLSEATCAPSRQRRRDPRPGRAPAQGPRRAERLYQLGDGDFPPLRTLDATNLPLASSVLVGREQEVGARCDALDGSRLVTFTGPGGTGKTRLALQVAADLRRHAARRGLLGAARRFVGPRACSLGDRADDRRAGRPRRLPPRPAAPSPPGQLRAVSRRRPCRQRRARCVRRRPRARHQPRTASA